MLKRKAKNVQFKKKLGDTVLDFGAFEKLKPKPKKQ